MVVRALLLFFICLLGPGFFQHACLRKLLPRDLFLGPLSILCLQEIPQIFGCASLMMT